LIIPGNPYPVTENPRCSSSLAGKPTISGHQSHYVITEANGLPPQTT